MGRRLDLHALLLTIAPNVYFQQPEQRLMQYPCIVYHRDYSNTEFADDRPYMHRKRYLVTVIDESPDSEIPDRVAELPMCLFDRFFTADNLNHYVHRLFF